MIILATLVVIHILMCCSAGVLLLPHCDSTEDKRLFWAACLFPFVGPIFLWYIYLEYGTGEIANKTSKKIEDKEKQ